MAISALREIRRARTLNQKQLARLAGVSQQTLSKWETGRLAPSPAVAVRLAAILGVTPSDIAAQTQEAVAQ